jgi:hypothetical protein
MLRGPLLGLLALVLGLGLGARAGELRVPADYPTIQAALDGVTLSGGLLNLWTVSDGGVRVLGSTLKDAEAGILVGGPAVLL